MGTHRRHCDGGNWACSWCASSRPLFKLVFHSHQLGLQLVRVFTPTVHTHHSHHYSIRTHCSHPLLTPLFHSPTVHIHHSHTEFTHRMHSPPFTHTIHTPPCTPSMHTHFSHPPFTHCIHTRRSHPLCTPTIHPRHAHPPQTPTINIAFTSATHTRHSHSPFTRAIHIHHVHPPFTGAAATTRRATARAPAPTGRARSATRAARASAPGTASRRCATRLESSSAAADACSSRFQGLGRIGATARTRRCACRDWNTRPLPRRARAVVRAAKLAGWMMWVRQTLCKKISTRAPVE